MSEPCEKCGADISHQGEYHTNCNEVAFLRGLLRSLCDGKGFSCDCGIADETWERVTNAASCNERCEHDWYPAACAHCMSKRAA
jgi:hypothetical protein